ncbi:MAG TPA: class III poly(R)-hydroxyalkanoic acid synthase subunit PhaC [Steroidobacter sp.]|jgi:polyhydroxyalkanoate synthase|nr:class III poly(R)-hydroxyalkanoic acid synthase subunit PhaC [Steroidobacteraceae bacterium]HLS80526.1 class III poly(R)-hydroxyalkanoic acid synthase subunit PhaC [Steroidobacter sp.]
MSKTEQGAQFIERLERGLAALARLGEVRLGETPKDEVYREDKVVLYRYRPLELKPGEAPLRTPVLICYALVNRPYMMDLQPDRSLIRGLLHRGMDVFLIDWGYPDGADRHLGLEDYVLRYLPHCVDQVLTASGATRVNLLGVCQGGALSLCYAALLPGKLRNLITMVTPVSFQASDSLLAKWARHVDVDAMTAVYGNVPGELLNAMFLSLMPFRLTSQKYVHLLDQADDPAALENFLRMEKWIFDSPDHPGEAFRQFINDFVKDDALVKGAVRIGGRQVNLRNISIPVLNIYARHDHLAPPDSSRMLGGLIGCSDYTAHEFAGGHIGIYVSGAAQREIPPRIASWLRERDG